jgi:hypothetical protein
MSEERTSGNRRVIGIWIIHFDGVILATGGGELRFCEGSIELLLVPRDLGRIVFSRRRRLADCKFEKKAFGTLSLTGRREGTRYADDRAGSDIIRPGRLEEFRQRRRTALLLMSMVTVGM